MVQEAVDTIPVTPRYKGQLTLYLVHKRYKRQSTLYRVHRHYKGQLTLYLVHQRCKGQQTLYLVHQRYKRQSPLYLVHQTYKASQQQAANVLHPVTSGLLFKREVSTGIAFSPFIQSYSLCSYQITSKIRQDNGHCCEMLELWKFTSTRMKVQSLLTSAPSCT